MYYSVVYFGATKIDHVPYSKSVEKIKKVAMQLSDEGRVTTIRIMFHATKELAQTSDISKIREGEGYYKSNQG